MLRMQPFQDTLQIITPIPEVGIYKRKQESKKKSWHETMFFDQEKKKDLRKKTTVKKKSKIQWKESKHDTLPT